MIWSLFMLSDSCEDFSRFSAISSCAKIAIFRKSRKRLDRKLTFAKFFRDLAGRQKSQNPQNESLAEIRFFANDYVSVSQRTLLVYISIIFNYSQLFPMLEKEGFEVGC